MSESVPPSLAADPHAALRAELATLRTEQVDPRYADLDLLDTASLVHAMNTEYRAVADAIDAVSSSIAQAVDAITARLRSGGRLIYLGAGTSGRLGVLDASECPPTFGTEPSQVVGIIAGGDIAIRNAVEGAEDHPEAGARDLDRINVDSKDAVVGISASGRTPYVIGALTHAKARGALTVGLACNTDSRVGVAADIAIEIEVGTEFLAGSTRLKAGSAQKAVLNMLSTLSMIRLGKTFGNVMVDLRASNQKLVARSERTVMAVTGADPAAAACALESANGSVKDAIFALLTGLAPAEAAIILAQHDGHLRAALEGARS